MSDTVDQKTVDDDNKSDDSEYEYEYEEIEVEVDDDDYEQEIVDETGKVLISEGQCSAQTDQFYQVIEKFQSKFPLLF